jgi:hypothetical protein
MSFSGRQGMHTVVGYRRERGPVATGSETVAVTVGETRRAAEQLAGMSTDIREMVACFRI